MKPRVSVCVLLLLLLFFAAIPVITVKPAKALKVATQWGWLQSPPSGEQDAEMWICDQVYGNFYDAGWGPSNAWGTYTQVGYVVQVLQYCQAPYNTVNWATIWWVGDFRSDGQAPPEHRGFYGYSGQHIMDDTVYPYANYYYWYVPGYYVYWEPIPSKHYFDFIWTCANGGIYFDSNGNTWNVDGITAPKVSYYKPTYTPNNPFTKYGFVEDPLSYPKIIGGMPYAFTGTLGMSTNGYQYPDSGSYCYIGWENISPWMVDPTGYNGKFYKHFPYYFYRYALGIVGSTHHTIKQSLDYASAHVCGPYYSFDDTILYNGEWKYGPGPGWWYCRMRVLGNGNLNLPY